MTNHATLSDGPTAVMLLKLLVLSPHHPTPAPWISWEPLVCVIGKQVVPPAPAEQGGPQCLGRELAWHRCGSPGKGFLTGPGRWLTH